MRTATKKLSALTLTLQDGTRVAVSVDIPTVESGTVVVVDGDECANREHMVVGVKSGTSFVSWRRFCIRAMNGEGNSMMADRMGNPCATLVCMSLPSISGKLIEDMQALVGEVPNQ